MVRGYQRKVVFLKNTGSLMFDEAYFLLRDGEGCEGIDTEDLIEEANRIIEENILRESSGRGFFGKLLHIVKGYFIPFLVGGAVGALTAVLIVLI